MDIMLNPDQDKNENRGDSGDDGADLQEKISIDKCITVIDDLVPSLEQRSFITEQKIVQDYKIQELIKEKPSAWSKWS